MLNSDKLHRRRVNPDLQVPISWLYYVYEPIPFYHYIAVVAETMYSKHNTFLLLAHPPLPAIVNSLIFLHCRGISMASMYSQVNVARPFGLCGSRESQGSKHHPIIEVIGDVGRPELSSRRSSSQVYDSIHHALYLGLKERMSRQVVSYDDLDMSSMAPAESDALAGIGESTLPPTGTEPVDPGSLPHASNSNASQDKKRAHDGDSVGTGNSVNTMNCANTNAYGVDGDGKGSRTVSGPNAERSAFASTQKQQQQALRPPKKKRRQNQKQTYNQQQQQQNAYAAKSNTADVVQHWDDPGTEAQGISYDDEGANAGYEDGEVVETGEVNMDLEDSSEEDSEDESRFLTHEEIWDDSALVAAWDAANEEYEVRI